MTDKTKYSNISVSKETYTSLQKLSKQKEMTIEEAERITGGLDIWGQSENFTPTKKIIERVINNTTNKGDKNGKK